MRSRARERYSNQVPVLSLFLYIILILGRASPPERWTTTLSFKPSIEVEVDSDPGRGDMTGCEVHTSPAWQSTQNLPKPQWPSHPRSSTRRRLRYGCKRSNRWEKGERYVRKFGRRGFVYLGEVAATRTSTVRVRTSDMYRLGPL